MLTDQEINRIFSWHPYRDDWPVNRSQKEDNVASHYGQLIRTLNHNPLFETYYSEDGGMGNYLEFICFSKGNSQYKGNAIMVCISLCAPLAAYGQTTLAKEKSTIGWGGLFDPDKACIISDLSLTNIESEIKLILHQHKLSLIEKEFACKPLSNDVIESLKNENHNEGIQYLHGIFQKID